MNANILLVKPLIEYKYLVYICINFVTHTYVTQKIVIIFTSVCTYFYIRYIRQSIDYKNKKMYSGMFVYKAVATFNKCVEFQIHQQLQQLSTSGNILRKKPAFFACFFFSLNIFGL